MTRKTNLFYNIDTQQESRFYTFSNYTEAMTGHYISTDTKLYPCEFYCANLKGLNKDNMLEVVKILQNGYENALAILRDAEIQDKTIETSKNEFGYLLQYLESIKLANTGITDFSIVGKYDITEQNYTGTYADIICIVENNSTPNTYSLIENTKTVEYINEKSPAILHGWTSSEINTLPTPANYTPFYGNDGNGKIRKSPKYIGINSTPNKSVSNLVFNVVIPMFKVVHDDTGKSDNNVRPLGIWLSNEPISVGTIDSGKASWSVVIGTQYRPIPAGKLDGSNIGNSDKLAGEFTGFAQILAEYANLITEMSVLKDEITNLKTDIQALRSLVLNTHNL